KTKRVSSQIVSSFRARPGPLRREPWTGHRFMQAFRDVGMQPYGRWRFHRIIAPASPSGTRGVNRCTTGPKPLRQRSNGRKALSQALLGELLEFAHLHLAVRGHRDLVLAQKQE